MAGPDVMGGGAGGGEGGGGGEGEGGGGEGEGGGGDGEGGGGDGGSRGGGDGGDGGEYVPIGKRVAHAVLLVQLASARLPEYRKLRNCQIADGPVPETRYAQPSV